MLYMDGAPLTWDLLVVTWTHTLPEAINRSLREMVSSLFLIMMMMMIIMMWRHTLPEPKRSLRVMVSSFFLMMMMMWRHTVPEGES